MNERSLKYEGKREVRIINGALITALLARFAATDVHPGGVLGALAHLRPDFAVLVAVLAFACNVTLQP